MASLSGSNRGRKRQKQSDSITCVGCSSNLDESSYAQIKKSTSAALLSWTIVNILFALVVLEEPKANFCRHQTNVFVRIV